MEFIDLKRQYEKIQEEIHSNIQAVMSSSQFILGSTVRELEKTLAGYTGCEYAVGVGSGTDALLLSLLAVEVGPGDEVITTPFSFISSAEVIALLGAKPVFVDILPKTYNLNPHQIESAITEKTKAILPVSIFGKCADFDIINDIADNHGLPVIEDAAQSFGADYQGKKIRELIHHRLYLILSLQNFGMLRGWGNGFYQ